MVLADGEALRVDPHDLRYRLAAEAEMLADRLRAGSHPRPFPTFDHSQCFMVAHRFVPPGSRGERLQRIPVANKHNNQDEGTPSSQSRPPLKKVTYCRLLRRARRH